MSNRQRLRLSFNMDDPTHAAVWNDLQKHNGKQRSEFAIACLSWAIDKQSLLNDISCLLDEKLKGAIIQTGETSEKKATTAKLPQSLLDFADDF